MPRQKGNCFPFADPYGMTDEEHSGVDADHHVVETVDFDYAQVERNLGEVAPPDDQDHDRLRLEVAMNLLRAITANCDARQAGRRALVLAFICHALPGVRTQAGLAQVLGLSRAMTCRLVNKIRKDFLAIRAD
mgnify:CR=1 FL=1